MKKFKRLFTILKRTGATKIFISFIIFSIVAAILLKIIDPNIKTIGDGIWYCYVSATTIGFGDIYTTTTLGRLITIIISLYGILVVAIMTGVVVSYYNEYLKDKQNETISLFLEKLEKLPDLEKKELKEISEKVKKINKKI